jgi:hypothetical protein
MAIPANRVKRGKEMGERDDNFVPMGISFWNRGEMA